MKYLQSLKKIQTLIASFALLVGFTVVGFSSTGAQTPSSFASRGCPVCVSGYPCNGLPCFNLL